MLRNRVRCATATTGTGTVTIGAAAPGFQSFAAAYAATAAVQYVIEEGTAWEVGRGTYTFAAGAGTLTRTAIEASSSGGAAIALAGAATVSVTFLASDYAGDWPVLIAARTSGTGTPSFMTSTWQEGFKTIQLNAAATVDTHGGFSPSTYVYTVPQTGLYDCQGKVRLVDGASGVNFGLGLDVANMDSSGFVWANFPTGATNGSNRFTLYNSRLMMLTAGQSFRLFIYVDSNSAVGIAAAELNIVRVR